MFSKSLRGSLPDATVICEAPVDFVRKLKADKIVWVVGGGHLLAPLIEADLIDEWFIQIAPVLLGKGKRLFGEGDFQRRLIFVATKRMGEMVELHYRRK